MLKNYKLFATPSMLDVLSSESLITPEYEDESNEKSSDISFTKYFLFIERIITPKIKKNTETEPHTIPIYFSLKILFLLFLIGIKTIVGTNTGDKKRIIYGKYFSYSLSVIINE